MFPDCDFFKSSLQKNTVCSSVNLGHGGTQWLNTSYDYFGVWSHCTSTGSIKPLEVSSQLHICKLMHFYKYSEVGLVSLFALCFGYSFAVGVKLLYLHSKVLKVLFTHITYLLVV